MCRFRRVRVVAGGGATQVQPLQGWDVLGRLWSVGCTHGYSPSTPAGFSHLGRGRKPRTSALLIFGLSDANPAKVHLTVPKRARLRREKPAWIVIHRADLAPHDITEQEGMPVTSPARTITDVLAATHRLDLAQQAITDARREGYLNAEQAARLRHPIHRYRHQLAWSAGERQAIHRESKPSRKAKENP